MKPILEGMIDDDQIRLPYSFGVMSSYKHFYCPLYEEETENIF